MNGVKAESNLEVLERSYYNSCQSYKNNPKEASAEDWAAYASKIEACSVIGEGKDQKNTISLLRKDKNHAKKLVETSGIRRKDFFRDCIGCKTDFLF